MKTSRLKRSTEWGREVDISHGLRPIGELMPLVLARHGIDPDERADRGPECPFVLVGAEFSAAVGIGELLAL